MKKIIFSTENSLGLTIVRVVLGSVVFAHGAQKLFGWFGGFGFSKTIEFFTETVGLPWIAGFFIILLESFGAIALMAGLATRLIAIAYIFLAIGIVFTTHIQNGFFMNWFGNLNGEGYEYFVLWVGMAIALTIEGGGKYAADRIIWKKTAEKNPKTARENLAVNELA